MNFLKLPIEDPYIDGKKLAGNDGNYDFMPLPFRYLNLRRIVFTFILAKREIQ